MAERGADPVATAVTTATARWIDGYSIYSARLRTNAPSTAGDQPVAVDA